MAGILERRRSLHSHLKDQKELNNQLQFELQHMKSLANIGMISSMVAHEINNILTPLTNYAQLAIQNPNDKKLTDKALKKAASNSTRAARILETMLSIAGGKEKEKALYNLNSLTDDIFTCIARDFSKDKISVKIDIPEDLRIFVEPVTFQQVLMNLILNARQAMLTNRKGGTLTIKARRQTGTIQIEVNDTGCGIDVENIDSIFEPFFTTKDDCSNPDSKGTGLGLAFCKRIIEAGGGSISVDSIPDKYTTFTINLPDVDNKH